MIDENGACFCMDAGIDFEIDDFDNCWRSPLVLPHLQKEYLKEIKHKNLKHNHVKE